MAGESFQRLEDRVFDFVEDADYERGMERLDVTERNLQFLDRRITLTELFKRFDLKLRYVKTARFGWHLNSCDWSVEGATEGPDSCVCVGAACKEPEDFLVRARKTIVQIGETWHEENCLDRPTCDCGKLEHEVGCRRNEHLCGCKRKSVARRKPSRSISVDLEAFRHLRDDVLNDLNDEDATSRVRKMRDGIRDLRRRIRLSKLLKRFKPEVVYVRNGNGWHLSTCLWSLDDPPQYEPELDCRCRQTELDPKEYLIGQKENLVLIGDTWHLEECLKTDKCFCGDKLKCTIM